MNYYSLPEAYVLVLVSQMVSAASVVVVVSGDGSGVRAEVVLSAAARGQQLVVAADLGHLDGPGAVGGAGADVEVKVVARWKHV